MYFQKIFLDIPEDILHLYEKISSIQSNACIAGGFLSDLYMKTPHKDIDFFIFSSPKTNEKIKKYMETISTKEKHSFFSTGYEYHIAMHVNSYRYKGYAIQLVFTPYGKNIVNYFDFRFREFIYTKGQSWASSEALNDIREKRLSFGLSKAPLVVLHRWFSFEKRYSFRIDSSSQEKLEALLNTYKISEETFEEYLSSKVHKRDIQAAMKCYFKQNCIEKNGKKSLFFSGKTIEKEQMFHFWEGKLNRFECDVISSYRHRHIVYKSVSLQKNFFQKKCQKSLDDLYSLYQKERVRLLFASPELASRWKQYAMFDVKKDTLNTVQHWISDIHSSYESLSPSIDIFSWYKVLYEAIDLFSREHHFLILGTSIPVIISNTDVLSTNPYFSFSTYAKRQYVSFTFGSLGRMIIEHEKGKNIRFRSAKVPLFLKSRFQRFIREYIKNKDH